MSVSIVLSSTALDEWHSAAPRHLAMRYETIRQQTELLCAPLETEDYVISSMPDVSPTKWHLAHTSWFFETFVLAPFARRYRALDRRYAFLFNSYYVQAGERHCRAQRGLVTRPTVAEVYAYRAHVDVAVRELLHDIGDDTAHPASALVELGLQHEQQHQELLLADIKHVFWTNPLRPTYLPRVAAQLRLSAGERWARFDEGIYMIGRDTESAGFTFDNEGPAHRVFLDGFQLAAQLVTNGDWLDFVKDGAYNTPLLWLSDGWAALQAQRWQGPLYWERTPDGWEEFTLAGQGPIDPSQPVCHVSYYEADAFARWAGRRLPTEAEWEVAAPCGALTQLYGDVWQWTRSPYVAYPGFVPAVGAIGEYNGKFMCDQWVLRGASSATPRSHARVTYRNFFPASARWQFTGARLAADL